MGSLFKAFKPGNGLQVMGSGERGVILGDWFGWQEILIC